jgi:hypothetical protein
VRPAGLLASQQRRWRPLSRRAALTRPPGALLLLLQLLPLLLLPLLLLPLLLLPLLLPLLPLLLLLLPLLLPLLLLLLLLPEPQRLRLTCCWQVRLLFQPAEEGGGGAQRMILEGALEGVAAIFGLHGEGLPGRALQKGAAQRGCMASRLAWRLASRLARPTLLAWAPGFACSRLLACPPARLLLPRCLSSQRPPTPSPRPGSLAGPARRHHRHARRPHPGRLRPL